MIPDRQLDNRKAEELARAIAGMYQSPRERWNGRGLDPMGRAAWEIDLSARGASFFATVPTPWRDVFEKQIGLAWPRATIEEAGQGPFHQFNPTRVARLELKNHYLFTLKVDRRTLGPLPAILDVLKMLNPKSRAVVQILLDPAPLDWYAGAEMAYEKFSSGRMPEKLEISGRQLGRWSVRGVTYAALELADIVTDFLTGEPMEPIDLSATPKVEALRNRPTMAQAVAEKLKGDALQVTVRVAVEAPEPEASQVIRSLWYAFRTMDGDQAWAMKPEKDDRRLKARKKSWQLTPDYLSLREAGALLHLPTGPLQEEHGLASIKHREMSVHPDLAREDGLLLGTATDHGQTLPIHFPTVDLNDTCLPRAFVAGMGAGKTTTAINLAKRVAQQGWTAVAIDPGKGEIAERLLAELGPDQVEVVRFGQGYGDPVSLDIREALHTPGGRSRLAAELLAFFDDGEDMGHQTARYLRAAAKAAPQGRLVNVQRVLEDIGYRGILYDSLPDRERALWEEFDNKTDQRRAQIIEPILNRLDNLLGDDYLAECMEASHGLDLVEMLTPGKVIVFDLREKYLGKVGVNVLGGILTAKLNVAMHVRDTDHPVFILADEPHQYMRSSHVWESAAVESRKHRFAWCWFFHDLPQMGRDLVRRIAAAGAHWIVMKTSKANLKEMAEEIAPITVEEALELWREKGHKHKAICLIQPYGKPVVVNMAKK